MLRKLSRFTCILKQQNIITTVFNLQIKMCYKFVNIPISSKYYHYQLSGSLQPCMQLARREQKLNQKIHLLQHIAELIDIEPKFKGKKVETFMVEQLKLWKGSSGGRFQRVASVAWIIKKMGLNKQLADLYQEITMRIDEDQWYVDFDESVKAIQSFSDYPDKQFRNKIFEKIERNLIISMGDVNMVYYQRICKSLFEAGRYRTPLWQKLQTFVTRNLSMQYSAKTFFDIFKYFAITKNGTTQFYEICQTIIHKGHLYKDFHMLRGNNLGEYDSSGDYFALMVETYALVNHYTPFPLSNDFLDYIYKGMLASKIQYYNISSLTKLIKYMPQIEFLPEQINKVVFDVIQNKQFSSYKSLSDVQQLYFEIEKRYGGIPNKLKNNVQYLIQKDIDRGSLPLSSAIQLVDFVLLYRDKAEVGQLPIVESLNKSIEKRYKYLQSGEKKQVDEMLSNQALLKGSIDVKQLLENKQRKAQRQDNEVADNTDQDKQKVEGNKER